MHVSNLLKAVLKPCNLSAKSSKQSTAASKNIDYGARPILEPKKLLNTQLQEKKILPSHATPKTRCLCAPTTHPGSFRCRLHRATRSKSSAGEMQLLLTTSPRPTQQKSISGNSSQKHVVPTMLWQTPTPHSRPRPSRLSRVVVATQSDNSFLHTR